jgi:hypothetical protein
MSVSIEQRRRHSRAPVHGFALTWWKKQGDEFRAAMQERNRSKVGRMARLRGEVETMDAERLAIANGEVARTLEQMRAEESAKATG